MSPPDSGDGVISPLKGGSEGRHQSTLPPVLDSGRKESAARDLDVEAGVSEEGGRIPDIEVAHAGQGDGDGAAVLSEEVRVPDDPEDGAGEWQEMPADWGTMTKSQRRTWKLARARIRKKTQG